jgi:beta-lactam-binding protein with PASTA domain
VPSEAVAPSQPVGRVYLQAPAAGTVLAAGAAVQFRVAKAVVSSIPDVVGKTKVQAESILAAAGFGATTQVVASPGKPAGRVWDQAPNAGVLAAPGSNVLIRVQPGGVLALVPNLVGMNGAQANAALSAAGFVPDGSTALAPLKPLGKVFDQNPVGGSGAPVGSTVHFRIAALLAPPPVAVPNLIGKTKAQALLILSSAGLVGSPSTVAAPLKPPGKVFDQSPVPGAGAASGSTVQFKVAAVAGVVAVPNLSGRTAAQAAADLAALGLGSDGSVVVNLTKPLHKVWAQNPASGALVPPGTVVHWKRNP